MQVLSSLSGITFYAPSAGFAPTNSGDVSAIASAYQVVSATATQLYAGTAYVTSVNDNPLSASRAGNAANASLANSAWYDGTGRLISALPDSAAVSAIASSYAESAVSSKLDASAASGFYTTANESGFVDSSYVDSAVSGKQDKLTYGFDGANISSIDGSALAGGGAAFPTYIMSGDSAMAEILTGFRNGDSRRSMLFISGTPSVNSWSQIVIGNRRSTTSYMSSCLEGNALTIYSASASADAAIANSLAIYGVGGLSAKTLSVDSAGFSAANFRLNKDVVSGSSWGIKKSGVSGSGWVYGTSEYNQLTSVYDTVSSNSASWTGGVDSATVSAIASSYAESAVSSKQDTLTYGYDSLNNISSIDGSALAGGGVSYSAGAGIDITSNVISAKVDGTTIDTNASGELTVIGGGGGTQADWTESDPTDPSYIENKPTPKTLTAGQGISIADGVSTVTISCNVTAPVQDVTLDGTSVVSNGVAAITSPTVDQTYDASSTDAQSGVAVAEGISDAIGDLPTNLTSAQIQALKEALGVDETVLYSGLKTVGDGGSATYNLSELPTNFQKLKVYCCASDNTFPTSQNGNCGVAYFEWDTTEYTPPNTFLPVLMNGNTGTNFTQYWTSANVNGIRTTTWTVQGSLNSATTNAKWFHIYKIIGVHRIASN